MLSVSFAGIPTVSSDHVSAQASCVLLRSLPEPWQLAVRLHCFTLFFQIRQSREQQSELLSVSQPLVSAHEPGSNSSPLWDTFRPGFASRAKPTPVCWLAIWFQILRGVYLVWGYWDYVLVTFSSYVWSKASVGTNHTMLMGSSRAWPWPVWGDREERGPQSLPLQELLDTAFAKKSWRLPIR